MLVWPSLCETSQELWKWRFCYQEVCGSFQNLSSAASSSTRKQGTSAQTTWKRLWGVKKAKDRKAALKGSGLTVPPSTTMNKQSPEAQGLSFLSPEDEGCSLLRTCLSLPHMAHMMTHVVEGQLLKKTKKTDLWEHSWHLLLLVAQLQSTCFHRLCLNKHSQRVAEVGYSWQHAWKMATLRLLLSALHLFPTEAKEHWLWFCRNFRESLIHFFLITFNSSQSFLFFYNFISSFSVCGET